MAIMSLTDTILTHALDLGFDLAGIVPAGSPRHRDAFTAWLQSGYHGEMNYLATRAAERMDPARFAPDVQSIILLVANYNPQLSRSPDEPINRATVRFARYAQGLDYHDVIKPRLYALDAFIRARTGRETFGRVFVDSAPVLERDFAEEAGLGFIGRNTCLITPGLGSWTFLAGLMVPEKLDEGWRAKDERVTRRTARFDTCGLCTRCLEACPTDAFVAGHILDARRCISYLTIELRGPIPRDLRPLMGGWVFGCDVCQEVCPYNRRAPVATAQGFGSLVHFHSLPLSELLALDESGFRAWFRGTPVMRARRRGLVRNACVAAGNSGDADLVPALVSLLTDPEPLVRGHAAWALGRIGGARAQTALAQALTDETDPWVHSEIVFQP